MPKAKTARLSLTLPGPLDANSQASESSGAKRQHSHDGVASVGSRDTGSMNDTFVPGGRNGAQTPEGSDDMPAEHQSPQITSLPQIPMSPGRSPHNREQSSSLFSNVRAAKSSAKIPGSNSSSRTGAVPGGVHEGRQHAEGRKRSLAGLVTGTGGSIASSQEDLRSPLEGMSDMAISDIRRQEARVLAASAGLEGSYSSPSLPRFPDPYQQQNTAKKGRGFGFMRRNASHQSEEFRDDDSVSGMKSQSRDRSGQRGGPPTQSDRLVNPLAANDPQHLVAQKSGFLKALRTGANKTVLGMKKQRDKLTKSQSKPSMVVSSTPRANPDYQYRIIYKPLLEQVRTTRIAPRLEMSRDKTEFWLPALPWRCIDYLNYKGVEEEGIYRHSGSLQHVNYYKQKFDERHDVNLYEEEDLYDVNVIASLLKAWLRDLPEPIFPSQLQSKLVDDHADELQAPDDLKNVIAKLAPWQYYLLFAITCHLSLIAGSADKNKMRIDNLFTCIGSQALKLDAHIFNWLVGDWRNCWMGCTDEKAYLEQEYAYLDAKDQEALEKQRRGDDIQPPQSSSSRGYPDSAFHVGSPSGRQSAPRPFADNDGRPGSSRSQSNLRPFPSYHVSRSSENLVDSAPSSANSSGPASTRATGSRKASQTDMARSASDQRHQIQVQNHQPRAPSPLGHRQGKDADGGSRERSPLGRRPLRPENGTDGLDREARTASHRRAQSQPRSDTSRGKSPSSQGRRRPRGDTTSGSPSNRSPSQGSDGFSEKSPSGRRRREGSDAPEMPTLQKEQRERYEHLTATGRSRHGSGTTSRGGSSTDDTRKSDRRREDVEKESSRERREREKLAALERADMQAQATSANAGQHQRKGSKFRLSEQKFPEPISPTWKG